MRDDFKSCPFCGTMPEVIINPLWHCSHGYYDCYEVSVVCQNENCLVKPTTKTHNTINGDSISEQQVKAWSDWNIRPQTDEKAVLVKKVKELEDYIQRIALKKQEEQDKAELGIKEMYEMLIGKRNGRNNK